MSWNNPTPREYAALAYALAVARGQLYSVKMGCSDPEELARIEAGTSLQNIAAVLGLSEADLAVDWNDFLTEQQKRSIQGSNDA